LYGDSKWIKTKEGLWCTSCYEKLRGLKGPEGAAESEIDYQHVAAVLLGAGTLQEIETLIIRAALKLEEKSMAKAARRLGIGRATIYRKVERMSEQPS